MANVYHTLKERGFIQQVTHEEPLIKALEKGEITFYIGFDPTSDSLTVGHFVTVMAMAHMQQAGHRPIALVGGGTGMVGDPSGKTDMRKILTKEVIQSNVEAIKKQLSRFLDFSEGKAVMANNADWLMNLNYVEFLRDIGVHFSVNRMLTAECFKSRMEKGLSFLEFNYMLMQSYDFLVLNQKYNCTLQMGGDDQWSNIISGTDLIRRKESKDAFGLTFTLLTTSEGKKMGKTESGAVWLDPHKTSPYDFYQYWRNTGDQDVEKCLALLTFLPMEEVKQLGNLPGEQINDAKKILAFEITKLIHGEAKAILAQQATEVLFGKGGDSDAIPSTLITIEQFENNCHVVDLMMLAGITTSKGEGRRLITGGGVLINNEKMMDPDHELSLNNFLDNSMMIRKGKKVYHRVCLKQA